jgi:Heterokaryon incompatibility protein (HET)
MPGILYHHSLDERLDRGPPVDSLCYKCKKLNLDHLFSGPRYRYYDEGFEYPEFDVHIGTVREARQTADECRFCYLVSAFHDAMHDTNSSLARETCEQGLEKCVLKPYRTDAVLQMKDESRHSDKDSIATSIALIFLDPNYVLRGRPPRQEDTDNLSDLGGKSRKASRKRNLSTLQAGPEKPLVQESSESSDKERCADDNMRSCYPCTRLISPSSDESLVSPGSAIAMHEIADSTRKLQNNAYSVHNCLFCLTADSSPCGRRVLSCSESVRGSKTDWRSLRAWLKSCESDHPVCRPHDAGSFSQEDFRIRCVDTKTCTIVPIDQTTRYLALSYVWGHAHESIKGHIAGCLVGDSSTIMTESLPTTVRDAIKVTQRLGERYLWVDCLCLDQSSPAAIADQIGFMDRIYENAVMTIIAAASRDIYSEIPGLRASSRLKSVSEVDMHGQLIKAVCTVNIVGEFLGPWSGRAWTFQEWVLSRRCLFFSQNQILFRCRECSGLESFTPPSIQRLDSDTSLHKFWADRRCLTISLPSLYLDSTRWNFQTYASLVQDYSGRRLTYKTDVLYAFTGIMAKLKRSTGMTFADGLPTGDLLLALLWSPGRNIPHGIQKYRRPEFPSWTWVGWACQTQYLCSEVDAACTTEVLNTYPDTRFVESTSSQPRRSSLLPFKSNSTQRLSVLLAIGTGFYEKPKFLYNAFRLRQAEAHLLTEPEKSGKKRLRIISETRSVRLHLNPPSRNPHLFDSSRSDLLHPSTNKIIAGRNFAYEDIPTRHLFCFDLSVIISREESFSSHDAILLYEWEVGGEKMKWHQRVIAMVIDRLSDGTVERLTLASIYSKDWYTLPLVQEQEELMLV